MPRIDPIQLLNCLSVLLSHNGGIKSTEEVQRLASLMTKFSKKLVSKCIYIQILKCTETELLGLFMVSGGWRLVHMWLTESIVAKNWPLVRELLELLLLCPVDIERLKTNNCPKLVKELSKDDNHYAIRALASKLVEQWLKTVKGENVIPISILDIPQIIADAQTESNNFTVKSEPDLKTEDENECPNKSTKTVTIKEEKVESEDTEAKIKEEVHDTDKESDIPLIKISLKDNQLKTEQDVKGEDQTDKDKHRSKNKSRSKDDEKSSKTSSSKHSSKSHSHSSNDKQKSSHKSSSSKHSSSSSKDSKDRSREKDRHSSHSSKSRSESSSKKSSEKPSSSSKSKEDRNYKSSSDKHRDKTKDEKNKDSSKITDRSEEKAKSPPSIHKLGKIPKLSDIKKEKPSISIEVRKPDEPKPKTVKTFHSKFRKHGLEEEVKPPPSRAAILNKKPPATLVPPAPKRPSPVHNETPPEKKPKTIEPVAKPGSIKLIPPKPKPMLLLESDMFMDALNASATNKKEPKKRKRRTSGSKDAPSDGVGSPPQTPTAATSPSVENKSVPPRFYQDTLESDDTKSKTDIAEKSEATKENDSPKEEIETSEPHTVTVNGLKGVLCYHKKKGAKKSIKWKPDIELEEIKYFELDETERVNVTKTFTDMKYLEKLHERESFQKARNLSTDDVMEERTIWRPLIPVDAEGQIQVEHGKNSKEKDIQAIRQKGTLQPLYFHKSMIPDSPHEPDPETHTYTEPTTIPLEDVTGNQDNISDFRNVAWPEPKGNAPPPSSNVMPAMFPANMAQFPTGFPPAQFPGMPGFQAPGMVPSEWPNGVPPMMPNGMPGPIPPVAMPPGAIPPGMMVTPENMMMSPEMFAGPNPMFPVGPEGFNMQQNMFPIDFNMAQVPPGPDGFGPGNFHGAMRGRGSSGNSHWRGKGSGSWEGPARGRGNQNRGGRKAVCIYFQRKGSCRQGDKCTFLHPGVNCPY